jgi:hypothetical protein
VRDRAARTRTDQAHASRSVDGQPPAVGASRSLRSITASAPHRHRTLPITNTCVPSPGQSGGELGRGGASTNNGRYGPLADGTGGVLRRVTLSSSLPLGEPEENVDLTRGDGNRHALRAAIAGAKRFITSTWNTSDLSSSLRFKMMDLTLGRLRSMEVILVGIGRHGSHRASVCKCSLGPQARSPPRDSDWYYSGGAELGEHRVELSLDAIRAVCLPRRGARPTSLTRIRAHPLRSFQAAMGAQLAPGRMQ